MIHPGRMQTSPFLFIFCQVGVEALLKRELAVYYPQLKFSFSRPGFCTFKNQEPMTLDFELSAVFAQSYGLSFGKWDMITPTSDLLKLKLQSLSSVPLAWNEIHVHLVSREIRNRGEKQPDRDRTTFAVLDLAERNFRRTGWRVNQIPALGALVVTLMEIDPGQWWLGLHHHALFRSPFPGGAMASTLPMEAPSRAYLKMKEALIWSCAPIQPNDVAVEFGSAPGGACYALLQAGLRVVGVDRAKMDAKILTHPQYTHLSQSLNRLQRRDFPEQVHWLVIDMNISMDQALPIVEKHINLFKPVLVGVLLTFKLNNQRYADSIPKLIIRFKKWNFHTLKAVQLSSHHREILVYGLLKQVALR